METGMTRPNREQGMGHKGSGAGEKELGIRWLWGREGETPR